MKKILLFPLLSLCLLACSVDNEDLLLEQGEISALNAEYDDACDLLAEDVSVMVCKDDIQNPTLRGFNSFFKAQILLHTALPTSGTYNPSMAELLSQYQHTGGMGYFETNYSVMTEDCGEVTIGIAARVRDCSMADPCEDPTENVSVKLCFSEIQNPTARRIETFYRNQVQLGTDLPLNGTFSPSAAELAAQFQQSGGIGTFATSYSVITQECGPVSIEVAVEVENCQPQQDPCNLLAQENYSATYTQAQILSMINGNVLNLRGVYLDLLEEGAPRTGRITDSELISLYQYYLAQRRAGATTISLVQNYNATSGECQDSAVLTLVITEVSR